MTYIRDKKLAPKNLNLFTIKFPLPAIISILHRLSGAILFLLIPFALWGLSYSFTETGFETYRTWFTNIYVKLSFWLLFMPFCYHLIAGIRHLLLDIHIGESLQKARFSAALTLILSLLMILLVGVWLW